MRLCWKCSVAAVCLPLGFDGFVESVLHGSGVRVFNFCENCKTVWIGRLKFARGEYEGQDSISELTICCSEMAGYVGRVVGAHTRLLDCRKCRVK